MGNELLSTGNTAHINALDELVVVRVGHRQEVLDDDHTAQRAAGRAERVEQLVNRDSGVDSWLAGSCVAAHRREHHQRQISAEQAACLLVVQTKPNTLISFLSVHALRTRSQR